MLELLSGDIEHLVLEAIRPLLAVRKEPIRTIYGIPRGGVTAAYAVARQIEHRRPEWPDIVVSAAREGMPLMSDALLVDDIVDTGATMRQTMSQLQARLGATLSLVVRDASCGLPDYYGRDLSGASDWVRFPWDESSGSPEDAVVRILEYAGRNPNEAALKETPRRFLGLLKELMDQRDAEISGTSFSHEGDDLVVVREIPLHSLCEHHIMPYGGVAHIGYIPNGQVLGLSKFARVVAAEAAGLTVQEGVTRRIAERIKTLAQSEDVAVVTEASHSCMILRGAKAFGTSTVSSSMLGRFREEVALRQELMSLIKQ